MFILVERVPCWALLKSWDFCKLNRVAFQDTTESDKSTEEKSKSRRKNVSGSHSFHEMVKILPSKLPKQLAENLSVPIAFVCLLHLANEKVCIVQVV